MVNLPSAPISSDAYLTSLDEIETLIDAYRSVILYAAEYRNQVLDQYPRFLSRVVEEKVEYDVTARHLRDAGLHIVRDYANKLLFLISRWQVSYDAIEHVIAKNSVKTVHVTNTHTDNIATTNTTTTNVTQVIRTWTPGTLSGGSVQHDNAIPNTDRPYHGVFAAGHYTSITDAANSYRNRMHFPNWLSPSLLEVSARWWVGDYASPLSLHLRVELRLRAKKDNPLRVKVKDGGGSINIELYDYQWSETYIKVALVGVGYAAAQERNMTLVPSESVASGLNIDSGNWSVQNTGEGDRGAEDSGNFLSFTNLPAGEYELYVVNGSATNIAGIEFNNIDILLIDSNTETTTNTETDTQSSDDTSSEESTEYTNVEFRDLVDDMNDVIDEMRSFATALLDLEDSNPPTPAVE